MTLTGLNSYSLSKPLGFESCWKKDCPVSLNFLNYFWLFRISAPPFSWKFELYISGSESYPFGSSPFANSYCSIKVTLAAELFFACWLFLSSSKSSIGLPFIVKYSKNYLGLTCFWPCSLILTSTSSKVYETPLGLSDISRIKVYFSISYSLCSFISLMMSIVEKSSSPLSAFLIAALMISQMDYETWDSPNFSSCFKLSSRTMISYFDLCLWPDWK